MTDYQNDAVVSRALKLGRQKFRRVSVILTQSSPPFHVCAKSKRTHASDPRFEKIVADLAQAMTHIPTSALALAARWLSACHLLPRSG